MWYGYLKLQIIRDFVGRPKQIPANYYVMNILFLFTLL